MYNLTIKSHNHSISIRFNSRCEALFNYIPEVQNFVRYYGEEPISITLVEEAA